MGAQEVVKLSENNLAEHPLGAGGGPKPSISGISESLNLVLEILAAKEFQLRIAGVATGTSCAAGRAL